MLETIRSLVKELPVGRTGNSEMREWENLEPEIALAKSKCLVESLEGGSDEPTSHEVHTKRGAAGSEGGAHTDPYPAHSPRQVGREEAFLAAQEDSVL